MIRLWIDTDVGTNPDDAVALLTAAAHPGIEIVGVSVVGDDRAGRARTAAALVPGIEITGGGGVGEVVAAVGAAAPDAVLAIGPLTNVAAVYDAGLPAALTIMGGAVRPVWHRGELRAVESNFGADPAAAAAVLRAAPHATVVPLDATVATGLDDAAVARLLEVAPQLAEHLDRWRGTQPDVAVHLHDPAALLVAAGEEDSIGARFTPLHLDVAEDGRVLTERSAQTGHNLVTSLDGGALFGQVVRLLAASR